MAAITDPRAITFCNGKVRPLNDLISSVYLTAKTFIELWSTQQMGTLLPFDGSIVEDGASRNGVDASGGDGRPLLTDSAAEQVFNLAATLVSVMERGTTDGTGTQNFANWNNVSSIKVNGQAIF